MQEREISFGNIYNHPYDEGRKIVVADIENPVLELFATTGVEKVDGNYVLAPLGFGTASPTELVGEYVETLDLEQMKDAIRQGYKLFMKAPVPDNIFDILEKASKKPPVIINIPLHEP